MKKALEFILFSKSLASIQQVICLKHHKEYGHGSTLVVFCFQVLIMDSRISQDNLTAETAI